MGNFGILLMICSINIMLMVPLCRSLDQSPEAVQQWFKKLPNAKQKVTKLHFYFHDIVTAENPTTLLVAQPNNTVISDNRFGPVFVFDDPLTIGSNPDSKIIGRAQGMYTSVSQRDYSLLMTLNFVLTDGKYKGSTLSVLGHNTVRDKYREMPILGGSGVFRLACGIATVQTYSRNVTARNAIVEYQLMVLHY